MSHDTIYRVRPEITDPELLPSNQNTPPTQGAGIDRVVDTVIQHKSFWRRNLVLIIVVAIFIIVTLIILYAWLAKKPEDEAAPKPQSQTDQLLGDIDLNEIDKLRNMRREASNGRPSKTGAVPASTTQLSEKQTDATQLDRSQTDATQAGSEAHLKNAAVSKSVTFLEPVDDSLSTNIILSKSIPAISKSISAFVEPMDKTLSASAEASKIVTADPQYAEINTKTEPEKGVPMIVEIVTKTEKLDLSSESKSAPISSIISIPNVDDEEPLAIDTLNVLGEVNNKITMQQMDDILQDLTENAEAELRLME